MAMQEKDNATAVLGDSSWNAEDLAKIMEAVGFEVYIWRDEDNGVCVVAGRKM